MEDKKFEFDAVLQKHPEIDAAYVEFPHDVEQVFGTRGQVKVAATIDGHPYRGSLAKMGHHCHCLGVTKAVRAAIGKQPGDVVSVTLARDTAPRTVALPVELQELLAGDEAAKTFFDSLSYTNRNEYAAWIGSAKKPETRARRLARAQEMLRKKIKHP